VTQVVTVEGRSLELNISKSAEQQLAGRETPLLLEMELYFSCLVRKRVYVRESFDGINSISVGDKLALRFRPVVTQTCAISECERDNPPVKDMPIKQPERYFPHWLKLDYRGGAWHAEFGYAGMAA